MKYLLSIITALCFSVTIYAQDTWTKRADYGGGFVFSSDAASFSIGSKIYVCNTRSGSLYMYDSATKAWTSKASFTGTFREYAIGFAIGNKGYFGLGGTVTVGNMLKDFWEYDPSTDTWTEKADFPYKRTQAVGFSIGSFGYVGLGEDSAKYNNDFWQYDPSANTWTAKANFGGAARYSPVGFAIADHGYVGLGGSSLSAYADFWQYDPATNKWTSKASYPGLASVYAVGFPLGNLGFIGTGSDFSGTYYIDLWEYNSLTNSWVKRKNFGGGIRSGAISGWTTTSGFIGLGDYSDFWEYVPLSLSVEKVENTLMLFQAYPNPARDNITIALKDNMLTDGDLVILDIAGARLLSAKIDNSRTYSFDLATFKPGFYFVQLISGSNKFVQTFQVLK